MKAGASIKAIADREGLTADRIIQLLRLAWLDPNLVTMVVAGRQPARLTANALLRSPHIVLWREQQAWINSL